MSMEQNHESGENITMFNDGGIRWCTEGERTERWLSMTDIPEHLENRC